MITYDLFTLINALRKSAGFDTLTLTVVCFNFSPACPTPLNLVAHWL